MEEDFKLKAVFTAQSSPLVVPRDRAVFFSNQRNRRAAVDFCRRNADDGYLTLMDTELLKALQPFNLSDEDSGFSREEAFDINALASSRFARSASGSVMVFYDKVSDQSTFFTLELPLLLSNGDVGLINGAPKSTFAHLSKPLLAPHSELISREQLYGDGFVHS